MTAVRVQELVERLDGVRAIQGGWTAKCPAHEDDRASLSVSEGDDGRVLLKCHAGCEFADIVRALDLAPKDLFVDSGSQYRPRPAQRPAAPKVPPLSDGTVQTWRAALRGDPAAWQHATETLRFAPEAIDLAGLGLKVDSRGRRWLMYPYRGASGWTYAKGRSIDGPKAFIREPSGQVSHPYVLGEISDEGTALVVEGERDALAAWTLGLHRELGGEAGAAIVSLPDGAKPKAPADVVKALETQRRVYVCTDADAPGDAAAKGLVDALGSDRCRRVRLKEHKDLGDVLEQLGIEMGTDAALQAVRDADAQAAGSAVMLSARDIFAPLPPVKWLCEALDIAPGAPVLVAGYGFSGKTVAAQDFALAVASGTPAWGTFPVRQGRVLHLDYEQGAHLTRLRYQRLARARGIDPRSLDGRLSVAIMPKAYLDADAADELARMAAGFDLVIVDSFRAACPHTEENSSDARIPLDRLTRISEASGVVPWVVHHARKPSEKSQGGAKMSVRGSGALYDACGSVLVFSAEKGAPTVVSHEKARISGRPHADFRVWIEDVELDGDPAAGLRVSFMAAHDTATAAEDRFSATKKKVLEFVRQHGPVVGGVNLISERLTLRKGTVSAVLVDLEEARLVEKNGTRQRPIYTASGGSREGAEE